MNIKICCSCKELKELECFCKDKSEKDGLNRTCRKCTSLSRIRNDEKNNPKRKAYMKTHKDEKAAYDLIYRKQNKEKIREYKREWEKKNKDNPIFKIKRNLRRRIHHVVVDGYKSDSTQNLLGCTFQEFKTYLESQFLEGMTWENYGLGGWHIDHIRPCCDFDLTQESEQRICFHYTNMRPLWESDNLKKAYIFDGKNCRIK